MRRLFVILTFLLLATPASAATYLISWNDTADNETGWQVEQKVEGGSYSLVTTTAANVMVYSHATGSSNYRYRVRAVLPTGYGPYSNEACVPTACGAAPEFPHGTGSLAAEPSRVVAGVSGGTNGTARFLANCNQSTVATAVSAASAGDTIVVPAGSCSWASTVTLTKAVRLRGAGAGSTTITGSAVQPMLHFLPSSCASNPEIEVTGFTFNNHNDSTVIRLWTEGASYASGVCTNANIHHNTFTGATTANNSRYYVEFAGMGGVVWKNTFSGAWQYFVGHNEFTASPYTQQFAAYDAALNTAKAVYMEDNILTQTNSVTDDYVQDCQFGGMRVVWRYNTWNIPSTPQCVMDFHGYNRPAYVSCQGYLMYGNQFTMTNNTSLSMVCARGGRSVLYGNNATTSSSASLGQSWAEIAGGDPCPATYTDHQIDRHYAWNNRRNTTTAMSGLTQNDTGTCDGYADYPHENWNYFNHQTSLSTNTGVRCGTLAQRDAITNCAERVGFYVLGAGESCSTVSGFTGDIVSNPTRGTMTGTLYVCGASNNWTTFHTPYTYPHPLRQGQ